MHLNLYIKGSKPQSITIVSAIAELQRAVEKVTSHFDNRIAEKTKYFVNSKNEMIRTKK